MTPIVCVGETLARARGRPTTEAVVKRQLVGGDPRARRTAPARCVVAYEPVWAIGTGRTATPEQAQAVHAVLRAQLQAATGRGRAHAASSTAAASRPTTPATLFAQPDIDGGLIGGASLKAADFIAICRAAG
ncbi:MAG: triose-phosphate isomerase [Comamonadaceae bacterium]|nr:triose-phosphate isomerase [Comamonadaceae bacterium]